MKKNKWGLRSVALLSICLQVQSAFAGSEIQECANSSTNFATHKICLKEKYKKRGLSDTTAAGMSERANNLDFCALRMQLPDRAPLPPDDPNYAAYNLCMSGGSVPDGQTLASANTPNSCTTACEYAKDPGNYSSGDPKCDRDPACKSCVLGQMSTQLGAYCTATNVTKKGITSQTISAVVYGVAGVLCGVACAYPALTAMCSIAGVGTMASDFILQRNMSQLDSYSKGWVNSAASAGKGIVQGAQALSLLTSVTSSSSSSSSNNSTMSCAATVIYLALCATKVVSIVKFNNSKNKNCGEIKKLIAPTNASPIIATCKTSKDTPPTHLGFYGVPSSVPKTFTIDDPGVSELVEQDPRLKDLIKTVKNDPKLTADFNKIGQKILEDGTIDGALADVGAAFPNVAVDGLLQIYDRTRNGEILTALNMTGEDTKGVMIGGENKNTGAGADGLSSELKFGNNGSDSATPQEGAESLEVGRSIASQKLNINSSDPFHAGDSRDLFRITSDQIKNQCGKKNVHALTPESRMNRMLSGMRSTDHEAK